MPAGPFAYLHNEKLGLALEIGALLVIEPREDVFKNVWLSLHSVNDPFSAVTEDHQDHHVVFFVPLVVSELVQDLDKLDFAEVK